MKKLIQRWVTSALDKVRGKNRKTKAAAHDGKHDGPHKKAAATPTSGGRAKTGGKATHVRSASHHPHHRESSAHPRPAAADGASRHPRPSRRRRPHATASASQRREDSSAAVADTALIDTPQELADFLPRLALHSRVALDTEADSLHAYREKLCLIQVGLPDDSQELLDPLAGNGDGFSLAPFYEALRGKLIVLHGADYDLRLLRRAGGFTADAVFDTMLAARLCGRREFSYAALVKAEFGVELVKGSQKANWAKRPLTETMASYARNDTRYLLGIADRLEARLRELVRWDWFQQSCARAREIAATDRERDTEDAWRIQGSGVFRGRTAAILRELWRWRDEEARAADRPSFHILRNEELLSATRRIDEAGDPPVYRHLNGPRLRRFHEAVARALELPQSEWPVFQRPRGRGRAPADTDKKLEALRTARDRSAAELDLEPSFIASRTALETVAANPDAAAEWLLPWQRELIGA